MLEERTATVGATLKVIETTINSKLCECVNTLIKYSDQSNNRQRQTQQLNKTTVATEERKKQGTGGAE